MNASDELGLGEDMGEETISALNVMLQTDIASDLTSLSLSTSAVAVVDRPAVLLVDDLIDMVMTRKVCVHLVLLKHREQVIHESRCVAVS